MSHDENRKARSSRQRRCGRALGLPGGLESRKSGADLAGGARSGDVLDGKQAAKPEPNTFTVTHTGDLRGAGVFIQGDGKQENLFGNMSLDLSAFHAKDIPCVFEASGAEQIQTKFQQKKEAGMKIFFYVTASTPRGDVLHLLRVFGEPAVEKPAGWLQGSTTLTFNRFRLENGDGPGPANAACTDEGNTHVRVTVSPN